MLVINLLPLNSKFKFNIFTHSMKLVSLSTDQVLSFVSWGHWKATRGGKDFDLACFFGSLLQLTLLLQPGPLLQVQILPCMQILQHHTSHCITLQHSQLLQQSALVVPSTQQHPPEILLGDFVAKCLCWDNALWQSFPSTLKEGFLTSSSKFHRCSITVNSLSLPKLSHEVCISALGEGCYHTAMACGYITHYIYYIIWYNYIFILYFIL